MSIYDSKLWISDLDEEIASLSELDNIIGCSIMITGCTGLICSAVVDILIRWNITHERKINILAMGRSKNKIEKRFAPYTKENCFFLFLMMLLQQTIKYTILAIILFMVLVMRLQKKLLQSQ